MKTVNNIFNITLLASVAILGSSCDDIMENREIPNSPYVLSLGVTSGGTTTYYVVSASDLMNGTIDAVGQGIEQNGFHDYEQGNQTIFCIGGMGVTDVKGITRNSGGYLQQSGDFVFDQSLSVFTQIGANTMMGIEMPASPISGDQLTFYEVGIDNVAITRKYTTSINPFAEFEWPSITGMCASGDKVYVTYMHMNPTNWETKYTDTTYVAVFDYPAMTLNKIMKDTRTGPAGSWYAHNGIFKVESGDMYVMSNSSITNGYSQSTKKAAFLRIPNGSIDFDNYYFDFETKSGGLKPAHIKYLGNGLVFAEVCTLNPQTAADRWSDKSLKCCIIDLNNQTIRDVVEIPIHSGSGGRRFAAMVEGGYVYYPVTTSEGTYIYRVNPATAKAERGAKVSTSFIAGFFRLN